ncbi:MAG TPA: phosphopyruvate hydratase, partial [Bacillota bacterium]|nr:phosphopyruvate hydratase [Bacillota bacterium]
MKYSGGIPAVAAVRAIEILDSRGNPTVKCSVSLVSGDVGVACVPSGASTGVHEAHELRDGDKNRYGGKGVLRAVANVNDVIAPALIKSGVSGQAAVDKFLCELDGTPNKSKLGANAILAVSLAYAQASAAYYGLPLYAYLGGAAASYRKMPSPMMNVINGGAHASNNIDIQEFMIVPYGTKTFAEALRCGAEIYHTLGKLIKKRGKSTGVGDEGGYAPELGSDEEALMLLVEAIHESGYDEKTVKIALDVASSEWKTEKGYHLPKRDVFYTTDELIAQWQGLCEKYPIMSIEDGVGEDDFEGWAKLTSALGNKIMLVGDDFFVTQADRVRLG